MTGTRFAFGALDPGLHDRTRFRSGDWPMDRHLRRQALQEVERRLAFCCVATTHEHRVAGYYTLASTSLLLQDLPDRTARRLPRHPLVPAVLLGRLAVDRAFQGQGLGGALLADALGRTLRSGTGAVILVAEATPDSLLAFYLHHGFIPAQGSPRLLFLPMATAAGLCGTRQP